MYAHTADRDWENNQDVLNAKCDDNEVDDIAEQLVHGSVGRHLKVIFGGGRRNFIGKQQKDEYGNNGKRTDGKDLINEWLHSKNSDNEQRTYVYNKVGSFVLFLIVIRVQVCFDSCVFSLLRFWFLFIQYI